MMNAIFKKGHMAFFIMLGGASSLFLSNIIFSKCMDDVAYYEYALLVSFFSWYASFGAGGGEQLINRFARVSNPILLPRTLILNIFLMFFLGQFFLFFCLWFYGFLIYFPILFLSSIVMIYHNVLRLAEMFVFSQVSANYWKFVFFFASFFYFYGFDYFIVVYLILLSVVFCLFYLYIKLNVVSLVDDDVSINRFSYLVAIFFNMFVLGFIGYGDRFVMDYFFTKSEVVEYFYLTNLVVFPYLLISNYAGFRMLVEFKKCSSLTCLKNSIMILFLFGCIFTLFVIGFVLIVISNGYGLEISSAYVIVPFLLIGFFRFLYSVPSAFIGSNGVPSDFFYINIITIFSFVLLCFLSIYIFGSFISVVLSVSISWFIRLIAGMFFCCRRATHDSY